MREVVIATRFERLRATTADLVRWADRVLGDEFPTSQDQGPVEMPTEVLPGAGGASLGLGALGISFVAHPQPRLWFRSVAGGYLVQLQPDWVAVNWEATGSASDYPRFSVIEELFLRVFDALPQLCGSGESIFPNQCEVTYVNHIGAESGLTDHGQAAEVFRLTNVLPDPLGVPERVRAELSFRLPLDQSDQIGRLHVSLAPGLKQDAGTPIYTLTMTARGTPTTADRAGVLTFVQTGHEAIVRGFASSTTEAAHARWGRRD